MRARLVPILVTSLLLVFAVSVAACGGDDGGGSSASDARKQAEKISKEAGLTGDCEKDLEKLDDGDGKDQAKKLCDAAKSGDTDKIRDEAEKSCEKLAQQIPVESERTKAVQDCRDSVK